jgi:hypothetical protein
MFKNYMYDESDEIRMQAHSVEHRLYCFWIGRMIGSEELRKKSRRGKRMLQLFNQSSHRWTNRVSQFPHRILPSHQPLFR